ncbi:MAG: NAD kinase [Litorimonas sp.]
MRHRAVKCIAKDMTIPSFDKIAFTASNKPDAKNAISALINLYGQSTPEEADVIIALGGDGFMLQTLRQNMDILQKGTPIYGMNQGTIGFLMNEYNEDTLRERLQAAIPTIVHPLKLIAKTKTQTYEQIAINEVSLFRQTQQAAHISVTVDGKVRLDKLIADGILLATPAGSTAYNLSAHGPVIPLGADILALTPISAFRPRRWRGALLKSNAKVTLTTLDPVKRPLSASADNSDIRDVLSVSIEQDTRSNLTLLFDADHGLDEKILREQFTN